MASAETTVKLDNLLAKVDVLKLEKSDVLVLTSDQYLHLEQREIISEILAKVLGKKVKTLILDKGMSLKVIRKDDLPNELKQQKSDEIQRHEFYQFGSDAFMMESTDGEYVKY